MVLKFTKNKLKRKIITRFHSWPEGYFDYLRHTCNPNNGTEILVHVHVNPK